MSKKRVGKIVRDLDLGKPKHLQHKDLSDLSEAYDLTVAQADMLAKQFRILVDIFGNDISKRKKYRSRADDRKNEPRA